MSSEFEIGDPGSGKDETAVTTTGGCVRCHREWPQTTFKSMAQQAHDGPVNEIVCDQCLAAESQSKQIAAAIDEAQLPKVAQLERRVVVSGIKSGTNVVQFEYVTHRGMEALITSDVTVHFCAKPEALDSPRTTYVYRSVPVVVLESWFVAPSIGGFFVQFVKNSYPCEKIK